MRRDGSVAVSPCFLHSLGVFPPRSSLRPLQLALFVKSVLSRSYGPVRWLPHIQPSPPPVLLCSSDGSCPRSPSRPLNPTCWVRRRRGRGELVYGVTDGGRDQSEGRRGLWGRGWLKDRPISVFNDRSCGRDHRCYDIGLKKTSYIFLCTSLTFLIKK